MRIGLDQRKETEVPRSPEETYEMERTQIWRLRKKRIQQGYNAVWADAVPRPEPDPGTGESDDYDRA